MYPKHAMANQDHTRMPTIRPSAPPPTVACRAALPIPLFSTPRSRAEA